MKRPNPLPPDQMSAAERRADLCALLAQGLLRLRMREAGAGDVRSAAQSSELSPASGESSLPFPPDRSGHANATQEGRGDP